MTKAEMQAVEIGNAAEASRIAQPTLRHIMWAYRDRLITSQQARTLRGQALHGDREGAEKGLSRLIREGRTNREGGGAE